MSASSRRQRAATSPPPVQAGWRKTYRLEWTDSMSTVTTEQALKSAVSHHQAGRLEQGEQLYRMILAHDLNHDDALHLLGVTLVQTGRAVEGETYIRRAIAIKPTQGLYHSNLGGALTVQGRMNESTVAHRRAVELSPEAA